MNCPPINDLSRDFRWSSPRCPLDAELTASSCPDGYKIIDNSQERTDRQSNTGKPYCVGDLFESVLRTYNKCYKSDYPTDDISVMNCCNGVTPKDKCDPKFCYDSQTMSDGCKSHVISFCTQKDANGIPNILSSNSCAQIKEIDPKIYNQILATQCTGSNLKNPICQSYCNENDCSVVLQTYCKDKVGDPENMSTCACYYPPDFYSKILSEIQNKYTIPQSMLSGISNPKCIYPACNSANIQVPSHISPCSGISLSECIQNIDVNSTNSKINSINIKPTIGQCGAIGLKPTPAPPTDGTPTPVPSDPSSQSLSPVMITGISLLLILILLILGVVVYKSKNK